MEPLRREPSDEACSIIDSFLSDDFEQVASSPSVATSFASSPAASPIVFEWWICEATCTGERTSARSCDSHERAENRGAKIPLGSQDEWLHD